MESGTRKLKELETRSILTTVTPPVQLTMTFRNKDLSKVFVPGEVFLHLLDGDLLARLSIHGLNHRSICTVSQDLRKGVAIHFQGKIGGGECLSGAAR